MLGNAESLRALMHALPVPVMVHEFDGAMLYVNPAFTEQTGFTRADVPTLHDWLMKGRELSPAAAIKRADEIRASYLESPHQISQIMAPIRTKSGERLYWNFKATWFHDGTLGREVIVFTGQDVTSLKLASDALEKTKEQALAQVAEIENFYRAAPFSLLMVDPSLNVLRINDAFADLLGQPGAAFLHRSIFDLVPALRAQLEPMLKEVLETGHAVSNLDVVIEPTATPGLKRELIAQVYPVHNSSGDIVAIGLIGREVTQRRVNAQRMTKLNRELMETVQRFDVALRGSSVRVWSQDRERRYVWISHPLPGSKDSLGVGLTDEDVLPASLSGVTAQLKDEAMASGEPRQQRVMGEMNGRRICLDVRIEPIKDEAGEVTGLVGASVDMTEQVAREDHVVSLLQELAHRSKNLLAVIQAMARLSFKQNGDQKDFITGFVGRLQGLSESHDLLSGADWEGVSMRELVYSQLGHSCDEEQNRVSVEGEDIVLNPKAAQNIGMALLELTTNALKYGALSNDVGHVAIRWEQVEVEGDLRLRIKWEETGGPEVIAPTRNGFGLFVVKDIVKQALNAEVSLNFAAEGVSWQFEAPIGWILAKNTRLGTW